MTYIADSLIILISFLVGIIVYLIFLLVRAKTKIDCLDPNIKEGDTLVVEDFEDKVKKIIEEGKISEYIYIILDIDDFKVVNKLYGKDEGDNLLNYISYIVSKRLKGSEMFTRVEADIFAILLKKEVRDNRCIESLKRVESIAHCINTYHKMGMEVIPSIGIYNIDKSDVDFETINTNAYLAKRMVKGNSENCIYIYGHSKTQEFLDRKLLLKDFNKAIKNKDFKLYLQMQEGMKTGKIEGAEVLVRWLHKDRGLISPLMFIELLEETGKIIELDLYVFEETCKMISGWKNEGIDLKELIISINVSRKTFIQSNIPLKFYEISQKYSIDNSKIELELTESSFIGDSQGISKQLKEFKKHGFSVAIDDFGSGYSSLNVLREMDVNTLKLDKVFLDEVNWGFKTTKIIEAIVKLSKDIGLKVIVEGVETLSQKNYLTTVGCDIGQGYLFSHPIDSSEFKDKYLI